MVLGEIITMLVSFLLFYFAYNGLSTYFEIKNLPTSKIRSVARGLAELKGVIKAEQLIESPLSKTKCLFYAIQRYDPVIEAKDERNSFKSRREIEIKEMISIIKENKAFNYKKIDIKKLPRFTNIIFEAVPIFYLQDETGLIKIYPDHATIDTNKKYVFIQKRRNHKSLMDLTLDDLIVIDSIEKLREIYQSGDRLVIEYILEPNVYNIYLLGYVSYENNQKVIKYNKMKKTFLILIGKEKDILKGTLIASIIYALVGVIFFSVGVAILISNLTK